MKITLKDGSVKEYSEAKSVYDIAADISSGLARVACAGEVNGEIVDLRTVIDSDCELNIVTASDPEGLKVIRHTASHVLAQAVKRLFPDAKIAIGPAIEDGFYYDFEAEPFSRETLDKLEAEMKKIIKEDLKIERFTKPRAEAIEFMKEKGEPYKVELIEDLPEGEEISFYSQGEFVDLNTKCLCGDEMAKLMNKDEKAEQKNCEDITHRKPQTLFFTESLARRSVSRMSSSVGLAWNGISSTAFRTSR